MLHSSETHQRFAGSDNSGSCGLGFNAPLTTAQALIPNTLQGLLPRTCLTDVIANHRGQRDKVARGLGAKEHNTL